MSCRKKRIFFTEITLHSEKITCRKRDFSEQDNMRKKQANIRHEGFTDRREGPQVVSLASQPYHTG